MILRAVDNFWTVLGMIILVAFFIISIPFIVLMEWLSGERYK